MADYQHVYSGQEADKFLSGEEAVAACGFNTADNPAPSEPAIERCPDCNKILGAEVNSERW